uniref:Uncharacterized protein n=1 Tax=Romanomermis culicivorax TaxID=13658 RepID=A0A915JT81_ROMCU
MQMNARTASMAARGNAGTGRPKTDISPTNFITTAPTITYWMELEARTPSGTATLPAPLNQRGLTAGMQDSAKAPNMPVDEETSPTITTAKPVSGTRHNIYYTINTTSYYIKPKLFMNQIQCFQDIMLGLSHILIMCFVFRVDNEHPSCRHFALSLEQQIRLSSQYLATNGDFDLIGNAHGIHKSTVCHKSLKFVDKESSDYDDHMA